MRSSTHEGKGKDSTVEEREGSGSSLRVRQIPRGVVINSVGEGEGTEVLPNPTNYLRKQTIQQHMSRKSVE